MEFLPIDEREATFASRLFGRMFENYFPNILEVGARYQRIDEWYDWWQFFLGYKDGVVAMTGPDSLFAQCDGNWTETNGIFYFQFFELFGPTVVTDNFGLAANRDASIRRLLNGVKRALQWPFFTLHSCYWAGVLLYEPRYGQDFPNFLNIREPLDDDVWIRYDTYAQLAMNVLFNLGFIVLDWVWMLTLDLAETDYWYRYGFVIGDNYMRYFYRQLYNVPVK